MSGAPADSTVHVVQPGESLQSIADSYGVDPAAIYDANRGVIGSAPQVEVGMPLQVTPAAPAGVADGAGATSSGAAAQAPQETNP